MLKPIRTIEQAKAAIFKLMPACTMFMEASYHSHKSVSGNYLSHELKLRAHLISSKRGLDISVEASTPAKLVAAVVKALSKPEPMGRSEILYPETVEEAAPDASLPEPQRPKLTHNSVRRIEHRPVVLCLTDQREERNHENSN